MYAMWQQARIRWTPAGILERIRGAGADPGAADTKTHNRGIKECCESASWQQVFSFMWQRAQYIRKDGTIAGRSCQGPEADQGQWFILFHKSIRLATRA